MRTVKVMGNIRNKNTIIIYMGLSLLYTYLVQNLVNFVIIKKNDETPLNGTNEIDLKRLYKFKHNLL